MTPSHYVPDTKFGVYFLQTKMWRDRVLRTAIAELERKIPNKQTRYATVLDVGCGHGLSFRLLQRRFHPQHIIAIDRYTSNMSPKAQLAAQKCHCPVTVLNNDAAEIKLASNSVDLVFCHQTFHHLTAQKDALQEFYRVLKPQGILLFAESTKSYIHSWLIRLLFRHPMQMQHSAAEYIAMIQNSGFDIATDSITTASPWWSQSDLGISQKLFGRFSKKSEPKLVQLAAVKSS